MEPKRQRKRKEPSFDLLAGGGFVLTLILLVAAISIYGFFIKTYITVRQAAETPSPEPLVIVKEVPVEVTVAPEETGRCGPSEEAIALAKTVWGEARGCSITEQAGVVWCVLNRVDDKAFPNDIISVVTAPMQFQGYEPDNPVDENILTLCEDVLTRWKLEKMGR